MIDKVVIKKEPAEITECPEYYLFKFITDRGGPFSLVGDKSLHDFANNWPCGK